MRDFNRELDTGHIKIKTFPGANSKDFPYCATLQVGNFDVAALHFGANDLLQIDIDQKMFMRYRSKDVDELILNLKKAATKCMSF